MGVTPIKVNVMNDTVNSNAEPKKSNAERQSCYRADKLFKTLPLDVQRSIERVSDSPEEKSQRTAIALDYQRKMATVAVLGAKVSVGLKQRLSMINAASEIGWDWIIEGYKNTDIKLCLRND